jgi:hypothetical protein
MTFNDYIVSELREVKRSLTAAIEGLSREDFISMEPCGHWPVAWITMHLMSAMDTYVSFELTGEFTVSHEERMMKWPFDPPKPGDPWPELQTLLDDWGKVMDKAIENVTALSDEGLQKVGGHLTDRGVNHPISMVIHWMVLHHEIHMRHLWCILGERRVDDKWDEPKME